MKLQINVPVSGLDLAGLLHGEEGLFLCQNRGQDYIAVAKAGHSIAYGPTPIYGGVEIMSYIRRRSHTAVFLKTHDHKGDFSEW